MIEQFHNLHLDQLLQNQFFTGAAAAGIIGAVVLKLRSIITWVGNRLFNTFVTSIELNSQNSKNYGDFVDWLFQQKTFSNLKSLAQSDSIKTTEEDFYPTSSERPRKSKFSLGPADGLYFGWIGIRPIWVHCSSQTNEMNGAKTYYIRCRTLAISNKYFREIIKELVEVNEKDSIQVRCGHRHQRKTKRGFSTVYLQDQLGEEIVKDMERFFSDRERYVKRGIQWKRNYLLEGPPGTGKSSLILALASHFDKSISLLPADADDDDLRSTYSGNRGDIIAFEDIDGMNIEIERAPSLQEEQKEEDEDEPESKTKKRLRSYGFRTTDSSDSIKLSTILNCLDGLNSSDGTISIITTNCPEKLDPAILRAGRIDKRFKLDYFSFDFAVGVHQKFCESSVETAQNDIKEWFGEKEGRYIVPAALQEKLYEITFK